MDAYITAYFSGLSNDSFLQMYVDGEENTLVLTGLTPDTEYAVSVFSIIGEDSSEPLKGTETTCKLPKFLPPDTPLPTHPTSFYIA